jgi:hypothetical protein
MSIRILTLFLGAMLVIFSKPLAKRTGRWQVKLFGHDFGDIPNRLPYIIVGVLTMIVGYVAG